MQEIFAFKDNIVNLLLLSKLSIPKLSSLISKCLVIFGLSIHIILVSFQNSLTLWHRKRKCSTISVSVLQKSHKGDNFFSTCKAYHLCTSYL